MTDDDTGSGAALPDDRLVEALRTELTAHVAAPDDRQVAHLRALVEQEQVANEPVRPTDRGPVRPRSRRSSRGPSSRSTPRILAAAAGIAVFVVGGMAGVVLTRSGSAPEQDLLARGTAEFEATLLGEQGIEVDVDAARAPEGRIVTLRSPSLPTLPTGDYYELWFLDDGGGRISAGTFHPDTQGGTAVVLHAAVDPQLAGMLEITREPSTGDPAPSDDVVAQGRVRLY